MIKHITHQKCHPNWYWDSRVTLSGSDEFVIWIVEAGSGILSSGKEEYTLRRGDVFVLPVSPASAYRASHDPRNPLTISWTAFQVLEGDRPVPVPGLSAAPFHCKSVNLNMLQTITRRIEKVPEPEKTVWLKALLSEIRFQDTFEQDNPAMQVVMDLCDELKAHPGKYRSIDQIPAEIHYSKEHLIRLFKKYKGATPHEYIIRNRINAAMHLLKTSGSSIREIARELGYSDLFSFSRQFKSVTGRTPTEFRKS